MDNDEVSWRQLEGWQTDFRVMETVRDGLPPDEQPHFYNWWMSHQESISWTKFKENGFALSDPRYKSTSVPTPPASVAATQKDRVAYMATELARTSPFFPVSKAQMKDRPNYEHFKVSNSWGEIFLDGPLATVNDENILLVLIHIAVNTKSPVIKTNLSQICKLLGVSRGKNQYISIIQSLLILSRVSVTTTTYTVENGERKVSSLAFGSFISGNIDPSSTAVQITLNPYFLDKFLGKISTGIDLEIRSQLGSDVAKALHRFISTHSSFLYPFNLITLCSAINLNTNQRTSRLRAVLRKAFDELKRVGFAECDLTKDDQVIIKLLQQIALK